MTASKHALSHALFGMLLLIRSTQGMTQSLIPGMKSPAPDASTAQVAA